MSKTILIIDDSATLRHVVCTELRKAGYETVEAVDGADALLKIDEHGINLIICDVNMPNMDGLTFVKQIKKNPSFKFIPILMLTTEAQSHMKEEGKVAGAKAWIVKPFKPYQIVAAVQKLIR